MKIEVTDRRIAFQTDVVLYLIPNRLIKLSFFGCQFIQIWQGYFKITLQRKETQKSNRLVNCFQKKLE